MKSKTSVLRRIFGRGKGDIAFNIVNTLLLLFLAVLMIYPILYIISISFNEGADTLRGGIWLFPRKFTFENYKQAFANELIFTSFGISVLRTISGTFLSVMLIAMMAFGLSDRGLPGRRILTKFFFFTTLFSGGTIPFVALLRDLNLLDTFWVYILPAIYSFYNMIIIRTAFENIPPSLSESAQIDGAGELRIFFRMYMPLSIPVLATIALFTGVFHWNDWFAGSFYVVTPQLKPAATLLQEIISASMSNNAGNSSGTGGGGLPTPQSLQMAFLVIIVFPILCVYPFLQKYFVKGAMIGSIKE